LGSPEARLWVAETVEYEELKSAPSELDDVSFKKWSQCSRDL